MWNSARHLSLLVALLAVSWMASGWLQPHVDLLAGNPPATPVPAAEGQPIPGPPAGSAPVPVSLPVPAPNPPAEAQRISESVLSGRRYLRQGNAAAALVQYEKAESEGVPAIAIALEKGLALRDAGNPGAAIQEWNRLRGSGPSGSDEARARLLLAMAELSAGNRESVFALVDASSAPDGLTDLAVVLRARAALDSGDLEVARGELERAELHESTNRLILEQAGGLAEKAGAPNLAGRLFARGGSYFGWSAERTRVIKAAGDAYAAAGQDDEAAAQYLLLLENYGWTRAAAQGTELLRNMDRLSPYHQALAAVNAGDTGVARDALRQAIAAGDQSNEAAARLRSLDDSLAWREAVNGSTSESYRGYRTQFPNGSRAGDAWFEEGFAHFEAGGFIEALDIWTEGASKAKGDQRARLLLWQSRALERLENPAAAQEKLEAAAAVHPSGYYSVRAADLLAGVQGWPAAEPSPSVITESDWEEVERWLAGWAGPEPEGEPAVLDPRIRRGIGLISLGMQYEAVAELNAAVAESESPWHLYRLARVLAQEEIWTPSSRAAGRLVGLSPAGVALDSPRAVQRMVYPAAYWNLVQVEAEEWGLSPWLLLSLIHQESRYDPFALSLADARGLTQVIPTTGQGIASSLGRTGFQPEQLFRPVVAVEFGAWYLANQLSSFGTDVYSGLAAYNAGAGPLARWTASDPDLFVERIDYSETKSYVRQIYLHHAAFRRLAGN